MPNEKRASRSISGGAAGNIRGSAKRHGNFRKRERDAFRHDASRKRDRFDAPSDHTVISSPNSSNLPTTEQVTPVRAFVNITDTFVDSVLSLCMKSATSCSDSAFMEFAFIRLVGQCGFVEAKQWAESLGLPYEQSAHLLSLLMFGPRRINSKSRRFQGYTENVPSRCGNTGPGTDHSVPTRRKTWLPPLSPFR